MQTGNWVEFLFLILACAVLPTLAILFRLMHEDLEYVDPQIEDPLDLLDMHNSTFSFLFSPTNVVLHSLISETAAALKVGEIKSLYTAQELKKTIPTLNFTIGIEFPDAWIKIRELPNDFQFGLHVRHNFLESTGFTDNIFDGESSRWSLYVRTNFLAVQQQLSIAFLKRKNATAMALLPTVIMRPLPYPGYYTDPADNIIRLVPYLVLIGFMYPCMTITKYIVTEKELQLKELMSIMGLSNWMHWLAWYVKSIILLLIFSLVIVMCWTLIILPKASVALYPYSSMWPMLLFLLVYCHSCIAFCFLVSAMCSRRTWASLTTCLLYVAAFVPQMLITDTSQLTTLLTSLFFNSAMGMVFQRIAIREAQNIGLQFDNMFRNCNFGDKLSIGAILIVMLVVNVISVLICLYIERVRPGEYGVAKHWCFPCKRSSFMPINWPFSLANNNGDDVVNDATSPPPSEMPTEPPSTPNVEAPPKRTKAGVEIIGLRKSFGSKEAVQGVSFKMYEDEITVLLGHNGAGKTTTILMLAGVIAPTSGTALINGYDIVTEREMARLSLGICPQHNILFSGLSVASHIRFFCRLRCLRGAEVKTEVKHYMEKLNLAGKSHTQAKKLSGGTQRRLSLACALCGNVKVVFCDEPSSGLDPASRHSLWKLMLEEKQGRTILLTTHYMDEGEVLGDRIAIMSDGQLRCFGTLSYLKKTHDTGYILSCERGPNCNVSQLTALVAKYIPKVKAHPVGNDVNYRLPQRFAGSFATLFWDIESNQRELDILGFGLSATSLADIFMSVGAEDLGQTKRSSAGGGGAVEENNYDEEQHCCMHCLGQWEALMLKKIFYTYHNKFMFLTILLIPILLWFVSLISRAGEKFVFPKLHISLDNYREMENVALLMEMKSNKSLSRQIADTFEQVAQLAHIKRIDISMENYVYQMAGEPKQRAVYDNEYVAGITVNDGAHLTAWFTTKYYSHASALVLNLVYNSLARVALNGFSGISIEVTHNPFLDAKDKNVSRGVASLTNAALIILYLAVALTIFVTAVVQERSAQLKMQQEAAGVNMFSYWLSHYLWDFIISMCFALTLLVAFNYAAPLGYLLLIFVLISLAGIPFTYVMGKLFKTSVAAFTVIVIINLIVGIFLFFFTSLIYPDYAEPDNKGLFDYIMIILYFYPLFVGAFGLTRCLYYLQHCEEHQEIFWIHNNNCGIGFAVLNPQCACDDIWSWVEIKYLLFAALLWLVVLFILEYQRLPCYAMKTIFCCCVSGRKRIDHDEDVAKERDLITDMGKDDRKKQALVVDRASKAYLCFKAVNQVSFVLKPGLCFGLLGSNGAGKTSLFKMIAGDHAITSGNIYIKGISLKTHPYKAMKHIGYCPQFDTLFTFLTGRQMLKIFCLLRGIPRNQVEEASETLASDFGFLKHLDKKTKDYSGGTKRKLNAALAASGETLILLDEPSAGVDPASRRHVWKMLKRMRQNGKTIMISSHSMEEVEAVCTRLAIMVSGNIHSLGSQQRIKNKFSKCLVLKLKVDPKTDRMDSILTTIENQMATDFPTSTLEEKYEFSGRLTFHIPNEKLKWSKMFRYVERNYSLWRLVDYSLTQKDLENIFLDIVKEDEKKKQEDQSD